MMFYNIIFNYNIMNHPTATEKSSFFLSNINFDTVCLHRSGICITKQENINILATKTFLIQPAQDLHSVPRNDSHLVCKYSF